MLHPIDMRPRLLLAAAALAGAFALAADRADAAYAPPAVKDRTLVVAGDAASEKLIAAGTDGAALLGLKAFIRIMHAAPGNDTLFMHGLAGKDRFDAAGATIPLKLVAQGGVGNDQLAGSGGADVLNGDDGTGHDAIDSTGLDAGDDVLRAEEGDDVLDGGAGDDVLIGGTGDDILLNGEVVFDD